MYIYVYICIYIYMYIYIYTFERGGALVMQPNFYTLIEMLKDMFETTHMKNDKRAKILYSIQEQISKCWDGVGEWRH